MLENWRAKFHAIEISGIWMVLLGLPLIYAGSISGAGAQNRTAALVDKMNANTLMMLTAGSGLTYGALASDLATVLNDGDDFRVLPVQGYSAYLNVRDVRYLRGIDLAFTQSNVLNHVRREGTIPDLLDKIVYVVKICNNEVHLVAGKNITSIEQLRGKKVNFNVAGSGSQLTAQDLFAQLGIQVEEVNIRQQDAFEKIKSGEIAATVALAGKPAPPIGKLSAKDGFHLLPIPFNAKMASDFAPTSFTHEDYPELVPEGQQVDTIADRLILIAYNWPRNSDHYRRIDKFVRSFFPRLAEFRKPPRHEKWADTVLSADLPGWHRFPGAEEWLQQANAEDLKTRHAQFDQFITANGGTKGMKESDRSRLFEDFLRWSQKPELTGSATPAR